jgi:hypothetical protein
MRDMARRSEEDRRDVFRATAQAMGVHEAIVEKDFWVCWALDYLFQESPWKDTMAFKGGTSLSKAFGAIDRFSEDIDLILDWKLLGYSADDPWRERSTTKQDAFGKEANRRAAEFLAREFAPRLGMDLSGRAGAALEVRADGQEVLIRYPRAFSLETIRPQLTLEIGPLAAWVPNEPREIRPYAAERRPALFRQPQTTVRTIVAERTFWEKATILHQEAHRGAERPLPPRYSRHYYDLYRLSRLPIRAKALERLDLLQEVAAFKMRFYRCPWARYEEARPGSLRLAPPEHHTAELFKDYDAMKAMLFGPIPSFEEILAELTELEKTINALLADKQ